MLSRTSVAMFTLVFVSTDVSTIQLVQRTGHYTYLGITKPARVDVNLLACIHGRHCAAG